MCNFGNCKEEGIHKIHVLECTTHICNEHYLEVMNKSNDFLHTIVQQLIEFLNNIHKGE